MGNKQMQTFVDIHTHNADENPVVWQLRNLFPEQEASAGFFSVGIHPWHIKVENWKIQMQQVAAKAVRKNCMAIGECGFDANTPIALSVQEEICKAHVDLANELQKPLIVHCVKAYEELLKSIENSTVPVILHDFGKSVQLAQQLQQKGVFLSVGKAVFRKSFQRVLSQLDKSQIFLETDDMECSIQEIYERAASIIHCDLLTLQRQMQENFKKVFK